MCDAGGLALGWGALGPYTLEVQVAEHQSSDWSAESCKGKGRHTTINALKANTSAQSILSKTRQVCTTCDSCSFLQRCTGKLKGKAGGGGGGLT